MISDAIARFLIMSGGILYPSFCSYKAIRLKDQFLYTKWTAYWVIFAIFHTFEQLFDYFAHLIPFYLELKIVLIFWLVSPSSAGSSFVYSNFIHNLISYLEEDIEWLIRGANMLGYSFIVKIFSNSYLLAFALVFRTKDFALQFLRQQLSTSDSKQIIVEPQITEPRSKEMDLIDFSAEDSDNSYVTPVSMATTGKDSTSLSRQPIATQQRANLNLPTSSTNQKTPIRSAPNVIGSSKTDRKLKNEDTKALSYYERYLKKF